MCAVSSSCSTRPTAGAARRWTGCPQLSHTDDRRHQPRPHRRGPAHLHRLHRADRRCATAGRRHRSSVLRQRACLLRRRRTCWYGSTSPPPPTALGCRTSSSAPTEASGPTLLEAYGGFEVSRTPGYDAALGLGLARPGRHLRAGQHPRRRRVRARLAPGRHAGEPAPGVRGPGGGRHRPGRPRHHRAVPARRCRAAATAVCSWA